jgi:hypothetical protein
MDGQERHFDFGLRGYEDTVRSAAPERAAPEEPTDPVRRGGEPGPDYGYGARGADCLDRTRRPCRPAPRRPERGPGR